jgi:integrase
MILQDAITLFLSQQKPSSRESYKYALRDMAEHVGARKAIGAISMMHMAEYSMVLEGRGYASAATFNKYVKVSKVFYNWLVRQQLIKESPARMLRQRKQESKVSREKAMPDTELARLLDYAQWRPKDHALLMFLADTGCRAGGAAGLKWQDIDWLRNEASVTEKGDKTRRVAFGAMCATALRKWDSVRPAAAGVWVFSTTHKPILASSISQLVRRACVAAGVTARGSHSLRHRKGYQLADLRIAPTIAAQALGHSDATITLQHYYPHDWDRAKRALEELAIKAPEGKVIELNQKSG